MASLMMPFLREQNFLDATAHREILAWTLENQTAFQPSRVGDNKVDPSRRRAVSLVPPREIKRLLRDAVKYRVGDWFRALGMRPFEWVSEVEAAAYGDRAIFGRHVDTDARIPIAVSRRLSVVYYYFRDPRIFEGGALRMHALIGTEFCDVEPVQNMVVAFPSYAPHEVIQVRCPSSNFADSRFGMNVWLHDVTAVDRAFA